jgi:hypothetical protein
MSELSDACGARDRGRELVPGSLRGYRTWWRVGRRARVPEGMLPLTAVTRRHILWSPALSADCTEGKAAVSGAPPVDVAERHRAPAAWCECGIYGWYDPDDTAMLDPGALGVFGVIQASGLVLMGDSGFRAEHAQIIAVVTRNRRVAAACEAAGIAVYRRRRDLLREYPPDDVSALVDREPPPREQHRAPSASRSARGLGMALWCAVWGRAFVVALIAIALPVAVAVFTAVAAELALILVILTRLRR